MEGHRSWKRLGTYFVKPFAKASRERKCYKFVEMNEEVNVRNPGGSSRAQTLWKVRDAKDRGGTHYDPSCATN